MVLCREHRIEESVSEEEWEFIRQAVQSGQLTSDNRFKEEVSKSPISLKINFNYILEVSVKFCSIMCRNINTV